jgi:hypothetical protein
MKLWKKSILPLTLSLGMFSSMAMAEQYSGYVKEVLTGASESPTFNSALIGMSATDGGPVERYLFTSDSDYLNMIVNARANHEAVSVGYSAATVTGVYYR